LLVFLSETFTRDDPSPNQAARPRSTLGPDRRLPTSRSLHQAGKNYD